MSNTLRYVPYSLGLVLTILCPVRFLQAQEVKVYVLSTEVQKFAIEKNIYKELGTEEKITLYVNTLTAIDLIAKTRAEVLGRPSEVLSEDYEAGGWIICLLPWMPPKSQYDMQQMQSARPKLVQDAFISLARRQQIVARLNRDLLRLSPNELRDKKISPLRMLNTEKLE